MQLSRSLSAIGPSLEKTKSRAPEAVLVEFHFYKFIDAQTEDYYCDYLLFISGTWTVTLCLTTF